MLCDFGVSRFFFLPNSHLGILGPSAYYFTFPAHHLQQPSLSWVVALFFNPMPFTPSSSSSYLSLSIICSYGVEHHILFFRLLPGNGVVSAAEPHYRLSLPFLIPSQLWCRRVRSVLTAEVGGQKSARSNSSHGVEQQPDPCCRQKIGDHLRNGTQLSGL